MTGAVAISRASPDHIFILEIRAAQFSYRVTPILPQHIYIYTVCGPLFSCTPLVKLE